MHLTIRMTGSAYQFQRGVHCGGVLAQRALLILLCFFTVMWNLLFSTTEAKAQTTYYIAGTNLTIATNASDGYNGLSPFWTSGTNGPWASFANVNHKTTGQLQLSPGDMVLILPNLFVENSGVDGAFTESTEHLAQVLYFPDITGSSNEPVVISNYNGGLVIFSNCGPNGGFYVNDGTWFRISGLHFTNNYRPPTFQWCTNWEFDHCIGGGNGGPFGPVGVTTLDLFTAANACEQFWFHNNGFYQSGAYANLTTTNTNAVPADGGSHGCVFGTYYATYTNNASGIDPTGNGIIESNVFGLSGHDCLAVYGCSNVIQFNWAFSPPWINWMTGYTPFNDGGGEFYTPVYAGLGYWT